MARVLLIGLGNPARGDDGAGPAIAERIAQLLPDHRLQVMSGQFDAMALVNAWRAVPRVHVTDAIRSDDPPGTVRAWEVGEGTDVAALAGAASSHALGLREAIELATAVGALPPSLTVWGVTGRRYGIGEARSPEVEEAIPALVQRLRRAIERDLGETAE